MGRDLEEDYTMEPAVDNLATFATPATSESRFKSMEASTRPQFALTAKQIGLTVSCLALCAATACGFAFFKHDADKKLPASYFLSQAKSKASSGNWADTVHAADQALEIDKDNLQARWYRAVALGKMADYEKALLDYNILADKAPHNAKVLVGRAGIYIYLGKGKEALDDCNQAIKLDPQEPRAYDFRAAIYLRQLKFTESQSDQNQLRKLNSKEVDPFYNPSLI
jgi:Flp pilus assembly protein TadD